MNLQVVGSGTDTDCPVTSVTSRTVPWLKTSRTTCLVPELVTITPTSTATPCALSTPVGLHLLPGRRGDAGGQMKLLRAASGRRRAFALAASGSGRGSGTGQAQGE